MRFPLRAVPVALLSLVMVGLPVACGEGTVSSSDRAPLAERAAAFTVGKPSWKLIHRKPDFTGGTVPVGGQGIALMSYPPNNNPSARKTALLKNGVFGSTFTTTAEPVRAVGAVLPLGTDRMLGVTAGNFLQGRLVWSGSEAGGSWTPVGGDQEARASWVVDGQGRARPIFADYFFGGVVAVDPISGQPGGESKAKGGSDTVIGGCDEDVVLARFGTPPQGGNPVWTAQRLKLDGTVISEPVPIHPPQQGGGDFFRASSPLPGCRFIYGCKLWDVTADTYTDVPGCDGGTFTRGEYVHTGFLRAKLGGRTEYLVVTDTDGSLLSDGERVYLGAVGGGVLYREGSVFVPVPLERTGTALSGGRVVGVAKKKWQLVTITGQTQTTEDMATLSDPTAVLPRMVGHKAGVIVGNSYFPSLAVGTAPIPAGVTASVAEATVAGAAHRVLPDGSVIRFDDTKWVELFSAPPGPLVLGAGEVGGRLALVTSTNVLVRGGSPERWLSFPLPTGAATPVSIAGTADGVYLHCRTPADPKQAATADELYFADLAPTTCAAADECFSGYCVDGVCCDTACEGLCRACRAAETGLAEGVCGNALPGRDLRNSCSVLGNPGCTTTGACDGAGACTETVGLPCGPGTCVSKSEIEAGKVCDASRTCKDVPNAPKTKCGNHLACVGTVCLASCEGDAECVDGYACDTTTKQCVPGNPLGSACTKSSDCGVVNRCVDGICCNKACDGICEACSAARTGLPDGTCAPAKANTDPRQQCAPEPGTLCGQTGECDGKGKCAVAAVGAPCGASASCVDGVAFGSVCDGQGACGESTTGSKCAPVKVCAPTGKSCGTTCAGDAQCDSLYYCELQTSACVLKRAIAAACKTDAECGSAHCADGVCCNSACDGQCEACAEKGSEGVCKPVVGSPRPARKACKGTDVTCGGTCDGVKRDVCTYAGTNATCASACANDVTTPSLCDGAGECKASAGQTCAPYTCDAATKACKKKCASSADCTAGAQCNTATGICGQANATCADAFSVKNADGSVKSCEGFRCTAGVCASTCAGATDCEAPATCTAGKCVGGGSGGKGGAGGKTGGAGAASAPAGAAPEESGCGCRVPASPPPPRATAFLAVAAGLVAWRRRAMRRGSRNRALS